MRIIRAATIVVRFMQSSFFVFGLRAFGWSGSAGTRVGMR
jgi:hypothetical protein